MTKNDRPPHVFYGWWVVFACFFTAVYTSGVISYGFTAVIEPIATEFGWSYTLVSLASSLRHVEIGLFSPVVGFLADRFGSRPVLFWGGVITGLGLLLLARISSLLTFYAVFGLISIGVSACGTVTLMAAVARWFPRKSGVPMGITMCGFGMSGLMVPLVVSLVDGRGWRSAMWIFGLGTLAVVLPLSLLVRNQPENQTDSDESLIKSTPEQEKLTGVEIASKDTDLGQNFRSRAFWQIALALSAQHMVVNAVSTFVMPYLSTAGMTRTQASLIATLLPIVSMVGRFGFGWLADITNQIWLTAFGFVLMILGTVAFGYSEILLWLLPFFLIFFGIGSGGTTTMRAVLPKAYFGSKSYGTVLGFITGIGAIGGILGAPVAGIVYDKWRDYHPAWFFLAAVCLVCFFAIIATPSVKGEKKASAST